VQNARWSWMLALAASTALAEGKPPLIVFELESKGASQLQAQAATQGVVRGLRELDVFQVLSSDDVRNLLAIDRTRQLIGSGDDAGGVTDISKSLGARHAVVGSVTVLDQKLQVEIRLLDTEKHTILSQKTLGPLARMEQVAAALPGLSQELVGPLLREQQGALMVQSSELGSEVLVDGNLVGSTPMKAPVELPRGQHRLQVRKDGFIEQSRPVRIDQSQQSMETFLLMPSPDYAEAWKLRHGRLRVGAYLATGVTLAAAAGAILVGNTFSNTYQGQFLPLQYALKQQPLPAALATAEAQTRWQSCGTNASQCESQAQSLHTTLIAEEATTIGLGVIAAGAAVTASYLWLTGEDPNRYMKLIASPTVFPSGGAGFALAARF
jgi:TolB-like protein